jgi:fatty-acyl-CoA synthase
MVQPLPPMPPGKNLRYWPPELPLHLELPQTSLYYNLEVAAQRYPNRAAVIYYGTEISYARLKRETDALAGFLQRRLGLAKGDRAVLFMQNCPQFVIAFYAILKCGAVVVPVNPMNRAAELAAIVADSASRVALFADERSAEIASLLGGQLEHSVSVHYADYLEAASDLPIPEVIRAPRTAPAASFDWRDALRCGLEAAAVPVVAEELAVIPYTSGTTGDPKGCMHTHASAMHTAVASMEFCHAAKDQVVLAALPFFHVTGLQLSLNAVIFGGASIVVMTRWDRQCAARLIERYAVTAWTAIPSMLIDFLAQPGLEHFELGSLRLLTGGGVAMPRAVAEKIQALWKLPYVEGYGLSETIATALTNPVQRPKSQCLGIPIQDTQAVIVNPYTLEIIAQGEVGEILLSGPQIFAGYWRNPDATAAAFVGLHGRRFFRTGDLGYEDEDGYFFIVDRLKRMINASGYKVWPAEVESQFYAHPEILEACVIAASDAQRGETVKLVAVLRPGASACAEELSAWARERMAAYKVPRVYQFVESLPKSATGKVQWRVLQDGESLLAR